MEDSFARALRSRLRDEAHPYKRRLKLCHKLSQVKEISKSESINGVILEWIVASISSHGKMLSEETDLRQWKMFHNLLQSVLQHDTDLMVIRRYLPSRFFQILGNWLSQFQNISEDIQIQIVCCCKIAIQSKNLLETLLLNFEDFASFLSEVIDALALANKYSTICDLQLILNVLLEKSHIAKLLQVDREEVFGMCVKQLLKPIAKLLLKHYQDSSNNKTVDLMKSALGSFLFSKSLERHFKQMLNGLLQESFPEDCPQFLRNFLTVLQEEFKDQPGISNKVAVCFPVILEEFLVQYKNLHCREKFYFFILLVRLLGIEATNPEKDFFKNKQFFMVSFSENDAGFSILADLLTLISKHPDILHIADNFGIKPTDWFQDLISFLLIKTHERCKSWFRCLQALLVIDNKIITSNFQLICDVAWLSLNQLDSDDQQAQSLFFCQVLTTFAKLQQSRNFIDRIITALSLKILPSHFKQFHLPSKVLEKFDVICTTLPSGQVLHLWKSLNNYVINYYVPKMAESLDLQFIRQCVHPVLELMNSFLLNVQFVEHVTNIPHMVKEIIIESINTSKSCIMPLLLESLKAKDVILLRNTLNLAHSWGEAHLLLLNYNPIYVQLWRKEINNCVSLPDSFYDLTFVHFYIGKNDWHLIYKVCIETEEPALQFMFAQLVAQKISALLSIKAETSEIVRNGIMSDGGYFVNLLKTCDETALWDKKISSINETNLPVSLWAIFCKSLPVLVPYLSENDVMTVARIMVSTFNKDARGVCNQNSITRSLTSSQHINEWIMIQSALTVAAFEEIASVMVSKERKIKNGKVLWEKICKVLHMTSATPKMWLQYANSSPVPSANGLNPLWLVIKDAAEILSDAFCQSVNDEGLRFSTKHLPLNLLLDRLMFLGQLPLEYFVPGNQIYCLFGILAVLIPIMHSKHCDTVLVECIIQCLKTVFALVDSMRSNWLLDLIQAQDLLLWIFGPFINFQIRLSANESVTSKLRNEFQETCRQFLEVMLNLVRGNSNVFNGFDNFLAQVEKLPTWHQVQVTDCSENVPTVSYAVIMMQLFQKMQRSSNKALLVTCQNYISRISKSLIHWFLAVFKTNHDIIDSEKQSMIAPFLDGFNIILEFQMNTDKQMLKQHSQNFKHWKKLIPEVKSVITRISSFSEDFTRIESSCQIMCNFCKHRENLSKYITNDIFRETWKVVGCYLQSSLLRNQQSKYPADKNIKQKTGFVEQLISLSSNAEFDWLLKTILNDFDVKEIQNYNVHPVKLVLHLWHVFATTSLNCDRRIILEKHSKDFIMLCQHALFQIAQQEEHSWEISARVIEVQASLIKNIKVTANGVTLCLQGCTFVNLLQIHDSFVYGRCFESICLLLNNMLISRMNVLKDMMPSFLAAIQDVMKSVIQKGQQELLKAASEDVVKLMCGCAHNIERLLAQIGVSPLDFTKVAPYIIANFVTESCKVTLYPDVKNYLMDGIYPIMQLCDEHAVAALQASLNDTARQVFNFMYETYMHYYQYKGKV